MRAIEYPIRITLDGALNDTGIRGVIRLTTMQEPVGPNVGPDVTELWRCV
jgi:hypothetical protein